MELLISIIDSLVVLEQTDAPSSETSIIIVRLLLWWLAGLSSSHNQRY